MKQRRYDIDALRSIAMFLLIFYHLGQSFTYNARTTKTRFERNERFERRDSTLVTRVWI
jgi:surface polysaccharide O-acyltransferase-like enzyme